MSTAQASMVVNTAIPYLRTREDIFFRNSVGCEKPKTSNSNGSTTLTQI
jgi:hypothetical protein